MAASAAADDPVKDVPRRRRLEDLYILGKKVEIDDGRGPVEVYIQKLAPVEYRRALDMAHAARARLMAVRAADETDPTRQNAVSEAELNGLLYDRDAMIAYLIAPELDRKRRSHRAELAQEPKWSKNDYYEGLLDAWQDGLSEEYAKDPEHKEAKHVHAELTKFNKEVERRMKGEERALREGCDRKSDEDLRREVVDKMLETQADQAWVNEFRKAQLFFALRDPDDTSQLYLEQPSDIDRLDFRVVEILLEAFDELMVEPSEGKD